MAGETTAHTVFLHGLLCARTYHYRVRSVDAEGNAAVSGDRTFATAACPTSLQSDEFNTTALNTGLWEFFNPLADATAGATGTHATISVPAGTTHDVWTTSDTVPRLLQPAPNTNLEVEAKFDSQPTIRYQQQGLMVEGDGQTLIRAEVHSEGFGSKLFVAVISGGTASIKYNETVPSGPTTYLQLKRVGASWTIRYGIDGENWPTAVRFDHAFTVSAVGPFAGNAGGTPPAFAANIDYFRVVPPPPPDLTPPALTSIAAVTHRTSATITWSTNELATSSVDWGLTTGYGGAPAAAGDLTAHRARLVGLACATTYHYRVRSTDASTNQATSSDRTFATQPCGAAPSIAIWRGSPQTFGAVGVPQKWINVLGNVEDPNGIQSLSYRLNSGQASALSVGPSDDRLAHQGDFNIELYYGDLRPGANDVEITATDAAGNSTVRNVTVDWQGTVTTQPPANGPVLVVVAHQDDEALGFAGVIDKARAAGRRVVVAVVTNGDTGLTGTASGYCGAASGNPATNVQYGLARSAETRDAMALLGLQWTPNPATTNIIFLGYPNDGLIDIAGSGTPWTGAASGFTRTYGADFDGSNATCNGELRYLVDGHHSDLTASALASDLELLLDVTNPSDIYTHDEHDGHADHAKVWSSLTAALVRKQLNVRVHTTLIHPEGTRFCQALSASQWPNPALQNNNPFARFTPTLDVTAPPTPACSDSPTGTSWGTAGPPIELVEVPLSMQATTEGANLKWQVLSRYATQLNCTPSPEYHVNCGYMRAFVKKHEFFWTRHYSPLKQWPRPYARALDLGGVGFAARTDLRGPVGLRRAGDPARGDRLRPRDHPRRHVVARLRGHGRDDLQLIRHLPHDRRRRRRPRARVAGPLRLGPAALRPSLGRALPLLVQRVRSAAVPAPARLQPGACPRHGRRLAEPRPAARCQAHDAVPRAEPRKRDDPLQLQALAERQARARIMVARGRYSALERGDDDASWFDRAGRAPC